MFRTAFTVVVITTFTTLASAQQDQSRNLFPEDGPAIGNAVRTSASNLVNGTRDAAKQTAHQTINAAKATANETRGSWTRFLQPQATPSQTLIDRWNQGTKEFLSKTKQALTPPPIDKPLIHLPKIQPVGLFQNVRLPSRSPVASRAQSGGAKKRSLLPSIFSREPSAPPKPQTVQDWMGQDRPQ